MTTYTGAQMATSLGITGLALQVLRRNPSFPAVTTSDGQGNITIDQTAFNSFLALWNSALANGWRLSTGSFPSLNFSVLSSTSPGVYYGLGRADSPYDEGQIG